MKKYLFTLAFAAISVVLGTHAGSVAAEAIQPTTLNGRVMLASGDALYSSFFVTLVCTDGATTLTTGATTGSDGTVSAQIPGCLPGWHVTATTTFVYPPNGLTYDGKGEATVESYYFASLRIYSAPRPAEPAQPEPAPVPPEPDVPPTPEVHGHPAPVPPAESTPATTGHNHQPVPKPRHAPKVAHRQLIKCKQLLHSIRAYLQRHNPHR